MPEIVPLDPAQVRADDALAEEACAATMTDKKVPLPPDRLAAIIGAVERRAARPPATERDWAALAGLIASAWPAHTAKIDPSVAAGFMAQLREEIAGAPADVLLEAHRALRRTERYLPSLADYISRVDGIMEKRRQCLKAAKGHDRSMRRHHCLRPADRHDSTKYSPEELAAIEEFLASGRGRNGVS